MDMLHFQSDEIASAQLVAGEEEQLLEERNKLNNFQKIADALTISYAALNGEDDSSLDKIGTSMNELASIESLIQNINHCQILFKMLTTYYKKLVEIFLG